MSESDSQPSEKEKLKLFSGPSADQDEDDDKIDINALPEMSVEEVDAFLEAEAPDFVKEVSAIGKDTSLTIEQIIIDDADAALHAETDLWKSYKGFFKFLYRIFPTAPHISLKLKLFRFKVFAFAQGWWIRFRNYSQFLITEGRKNIFATAKMVVQQIGGQIRQSLNTFKKVSLKTKLILVGSIAIVALAGLVLRQSLTHGLLPESKEMFLTGFTNHATQAFDYQPEEVESYLNNARASQNLFLTKKIIANLKPAANAGPNSNPMGAFEFFIEGMSSDVVVEIKDREAMVRDLMQTTIQEMTFDELDTGAGKKELCTRLQNEISKVLTTGSVKVVRIKTIVIKP